MPLQPIPVPNDLRQRARNAFSRISEIHFRNPAFWFQNIGFNDQLENQTWLLARLTTTPDLTQYRHQLEVAEAFINNAPGMANPQASVGIAPPPPPMPPAHGAPAFPAPPANPQGSGGRIIPRLQRVRQRIASIRDRRRNKQNDETTRTPYMIVHIFPSPAPKKKWRATFTRGKDNKTTHTDFGAVGMDDYTIHHDDKRKANFLRRFHNKIVAAELDPTSAMTLSTWLLWNDKSLEKSFKLYLKKYKLKGTLDMKEEGGATALERGVAAEMREKYPKRFLQSKAIDGQQPRISFNEALNAVVHDRNDQPLQRLDVYHYDQLQKTRPHYNANDLRKIVGTIDTEERYGRVKPVPHWNQSIYIPRS